MTDQIKAAVIFILLLGALAAGWFVRAWYDGSREAVLLAAQKETRDKMTELVGDLATAYEVTNAKIRTINRDIYHETVRETRNPAYDCPLVESGRVLVNQARGADRPAAGESGGAVRSDAPH